LLDRSFEVYRDEPLLPGAAGDVSAARLVARQILWAGGRLVVAVPDPSLATLMLTATCLHCVSERGDDAWRRDLVVSLTALLNAGLDGPSLSRSPMQFVRYAASELQALTPDLRIQLLEALIQLVCENIGSEAPPCDKIVKNNSDVIL